MSEHIHIRQATPDDLEALIPLVDQYRKTILENYSSDPAATDSFVRLLLKSKICITFIVLNKLSGRIGGFANVFKNFTTLGLQPIWILNDLFVAEQERGKGSAHAVIEYILHSAKNSGAIRLELKTEKDNGAAQKLYSKLGFIVDNAHFYYRVPLL